MANPFVRPADPQIVDNRERCPTCNMLAPRHKRWCITPVIQGDATMETRETEGTQTPCCDNAGLYVKEESDNG